MHLSGVIITWTERVYVFGCDDVVFAHADVGFCVRTCFRDDVIKASFMGHEAPPARRLYSALIICAGCVRRTTVLRRALSESDMVMYSQQDVASTEKRGLGGE
jgi:hypothetical protein